MAKTEKADVPALAGLTAEQLTECFQLGASLEQVKELADAGFGYEQIKKLAATLGGAKAGPGGGVSAGDLKALLEAQKKALRPENERHPGISAFSYPEGEVARPKPAFVRDVFFNGGRERHDQLSVIEVELYNRFDQTRTARGGMWRAEVRRNGSAEELHIITEPRTLDGRQSLPPLTMLLRELLDGEAAANPDKLAERVAELEARIKALAPVAA